MHKLTMSQLQSTKKRLSQICNLAHIDYAALKPKLAEAWLKSEVGTESGTLHFQYLNHYKQERRELKTTISVIETSIKAVKAEMLRKREIERVNRAR